MHWQHRRSTCFHHNNCPSHAAHGRDLNEFIITIISMDVMASLAGPPSL
jgi:hypothetical protein